MEGKESREIQLTTEDDNNKCATCLKAAYESGRDSGKEPSVYANTMVACDPKCPLYSGQTITFDKNPFEKKGNL